MRWQQPDFTSRGAILIFLRFVALLAVLYIVTAVFVWLGPLGQVSFLLFLVAHGSLMVALTAGMAWVRMIKPRNAAMIAFRSEQLRHAEQLEVEAALSDFDARFSAASELADSEADAYEVVQRGLRQVLQERPAELLMADSSQANLRAVAVSGADDVGPGCPVPSPARCPAVRGGRTLTYEDSEALDACPHLRNRGHDDPLSATCVPVNVLGQSIGVLHTVGAVGEVSDAGETRGLETIARVAGGRIAMVRVLNETETAATTDALTGLMNRRLLENRVRLLLRGSAEFSVVMADLDRFKQLNDVHGHETGDRALRVFAEVCTATLRPDDLVCRYGGEEFVLVLPSTNSELAGRAVERLRDALSVRLASGEVPPFTCSFGIAHSTMGDTFDEMLLVSDRALYAAKDGGRDRAVIASSRDGAGAVIGQGGPSVVDPSS